MAGPATVRVRCRADASLVDVREAQAGQLHYARKLRFPSWARSASRPIVDCPDRNAPFSSTGRGAMLFDVLG